MAYSVVSSKEERLIKTSHALLGTLPLLASGQGNVRRSTLSQGQRALICLGRMQL
jgi:hypothetical protein